MLRALFLSLCTAMVLTACGTNPVTHKTEFQFVSEAKEIDMGKQSYVPARQQQGGDYIIDPELTAYVQSVGNKLAAVSDRQLPYEFVILNDSVPNAWAMPGGKIAFNRGLLYELNSEAELAAVLGHEIVHAAARHGAKQMEDGMLLQGAVLAAAAASNGTNYSRLAVGGAQLSSQLMSMKFGRDDESEADHYGMIYMKRAGYDPRAAVTLQETFVRLSQGQHSDFIKGLFASHPPSEERVQANKDTLAEIGEGGEWGREIYAQKVAHLKATQAAYKDYDQAKQILATDPNKAAALDKQAIAIEPREARFQELLGDVALAQKNNQSALSYYDKAIKMQPDYFRPHVQSGIALNNLGRKVEAEKELNRSNALLPTATGHLLLGQLAESRGDVNTALQNYQIAASSNSPEGLASSANFLRLDLPRNPAKYLQADVQLDLNGNLYAIVQNPTSVTLSKVQFRVLRINPANGQLVAQSLPMNISVPLAPNQQEFVRVAGVRLTNPQDVNLFRVQLESAEVASN